MDQAKAGAAGESWRINNPGALSTLWTLKPQSKSSEMGGCSYQFDHKVGATPVNHHGIIISKGNPAGYTHPPAGASKITQIDLIKVAGQTFLCEPRHFSFLNQLGT
jgi:hypothetical protein